MQRAFNKLIIPPGRMEPLRLSSGALLINDSYNANPDSLAPALQTLSTARARRKIVVLGKMLELGSSSIREHRRAGASAARAGAHEIVAVGEHAKLILAGAKRAGLKTSQLHNCHDAHEAGRTLKERLRRGDLVLLKGSRGAHLEDVLKHLSVRRAA